MGSSNTLLNLVAAENDANKQKESLELSVEAEAMKLEFSNSNFKLQNQDGAMKETMDEEVANVWTKIEMADKKVKMADKN